MRFGIIVVQSLANVLPIRYLVSVLLQWHYNEDNGVSTHRRLDCLLNSLFRCRLKKTSKLRVTGLWDGNPPVTGGFPSQNASNTEMLPFDDFIMLYHIVFDCIIIWFRARRLFFPQLGSRTTIKQYRLVRNRNLLGHDYIFFNNEKQKFLLQD